MILLIAAIAGLTAMTGCGDDDDSASDSDEVQAVAVTTSSLSKAEFLKRAKPLCARKIESILPAIDAYAAKNRSEENLPAPVRNANLIKAVMAPVAEEQIAVVRKLGAPAGDEKQVEAMLTAQRQAVDEVKELETLDPNQYVQEYFTDAQNMFRAYGLEECAFNF